MIVGGDDADRAPLLGPVRLSASSAVTWLPSGARGAASAPARAASRRCGGRAARWPVPRRPRRPRRRRRRAARGRARRAAVARRAAATPAAIGRRFVAAVIGPSEAIAPSVLECALEDDEAEAVRAGRGVEERRGEQRRGRGVVGEGDQERLAGDVADAVAEAGGQAAERRRAPAQRAGDDDEAGGRECDKPAVEGALLVVGRERPALAASAIRPARREQGADLLAPHRERPLATCDEDDEQADAAGGDGLHERQRGKRQRGEVEAPSRPGRGEPAEPAAARRAARGPMRAGRRSESSRSVRDGALLEQEARVQRERGRERQAEPAGERRRHARLRQGAEGSVT